MMMMRHALYRRAAQVRLDAMLMIDTLLASLDDHILSRRAMRIADVARPPQCRLILAP